jgi:hypothetical protein
MDTEKLMNTIDTRIEDAKRYAYSSAEYNESIYRGNIDKLNETRGMLFVLSLDFAPVNFQEYRETIDLLVYSLEKKIERANRYQGWSNYETWNASLWLNNDYGLYQDVTAQAEESEDASELARYLENLISEAAPSVDGMFSDLLGAALNAIDWNEVAEGFKPDDGWLSERDEETEDEETEE